MSQKIHNIFDSKLSYQSIYNAYIHTKRLKAYRKDVIKFEFKLEYNINRIYQKLKSESYEFGKYNEFYVYEPKKRRILSASFEDRIVHTWYVKNFLEPYFVPTFIDTTYACILNKGMHKCALDVQKTIYTCSYLDEYRYGYILKMDVSKYFDNIDKNVLYSILAKKIDDKKFLKLTKKLLDSTSKYYTKENIGIPIGNYTSQMFANIYLDKLDKYIKNQIKCKYVFRYMDDIACIFKNKSDAKNALSLIIIFLKFKLGLSLNSKTQIFKISQGINFCGYKINKYGLKIRDKGKRRLNRKIRVLKKILDKGLITTKIARQKLAGHIGYIKISNKKGLIR